MPLELKAPKFDKSFEDIYRELRAQIPRFAPAWTNFNDSDPGITLVQLFSWLAETLYFQMGQVPINNYLKFVKLLGLDLRAPRPAEADLAFLPKGKERPGLVPGESRFGAAVDDGQPPLIFETTRDLAVIGTTLVAASVINSGQTSSVLAANQVAGQAYYPLGRSPEIGAALYLGFKDWPRTDSPFPAEMSWLALLPAQVTAGRPQLVSEQVELLRPPVKLVWEYLPAPADQNWQLLNTYEDRSIAFTRDGYIRVEGPQQIKPVPLPALYPDPCFWLRVRLAEQAYPSGRAPQLDSLTPNVVRVRNLTTERDRLLGTSSGRAGQVFTFPQRPIDPESLVLEIGRPPVRWKRVEFFESSNRGDTHYVLDPAAGTITFGDGEQGRIPESGAEIMARSYRFGGGDRGNKAGPGSIKTMLTQVVGIDKVSNERAAYGGTVEETIAQIQARVPAELRRQHRAVTEEDFQTLAKDLGGVSQAKAIAGRHPDYADAVIPGSVTVYLVADTEALPPEPAKELVASVSAVLDQARLITTEVYVTGARFQEIRVETRLLARPEASFDRVSRDAQTRLRALLNPHTRVFGRDLFPADLYKALLEDQDVVSVDSLLIYVDGVEHDSPKQVPVRTDTVLYSGNHVITVNRDEDR